MIMWTGIEGRKGSYPLVTGVVRSVLLICKSTIYLLPSPFYFSMKEHSIRKLFRYWISNKIFILHFVTNMHPQQETGCGWHVLVFLGQEIWCVHKTSGEGSYLENWETLSRIKHHKGLEMDSLPLHFLLKSHLFLAQGCGKCHSGQNLHVVQTAGKSVRDHPIETIAELWNGWIVKWLNREKII